MRALISAAVTALGLAVTAAMPAYAQYATGGSGQYRSQILWFDWGNNGANIPQAGTTVTNTITVAGQPLAVTCTLNGISGTGADPDLRIYRPGGYFEDGLDDLYNIGGTGGANTMDIGVTNRNIATQATFTFACSATLGGNPYTLDGLVFADAETTNEAEFIRTTLPAGATMRVIERNRGAGCTTGYNVNLTGSTYAFSTLSPYTCSPNNPNSMGVYFIDNASSATITFGSQGGLQSVAVGVMLNVADYGDAPASYGSAAHLPQYSWSGGTLTAGDTNIFSSGFNLASLGQPATALLGARVDVENPAWSGAGATLDDSNGGADDEDSVNVAALAPLSVGSGGTSYTVPVSCVGTAPIAGWIDFDRSGAFDADERSTTVNCTGGSASLNWTVTGDIAAGQTYLRVRTAANASEIASPTGIAGTGEAEDYGLTIASQPSFGTCDGRMWLSQTATLYDVGVATNPFTYTAIGTSPFNINAIDFSAADNYLYGIRVTTSNELIKIGADGVAVSLGAVTNLPAATYISGGFNEAGTHLYVLNNSAPTGLLYAVNVATRTAAVINLSRSVTIADIAWVNGALYTVELNGQLIRIDPVTGTVTNVGAPNGVTNGTYFGGIVGAPNGLFGVLNSGGFYQIDLATGGVTLLSSAPASNANDAAHCPAAPLAFGADVSVTKTNTPAQGPNDLSDDTYLLGQSRTYTVVVTNAGPFGVQNATVSDPLPAGIEAGTASWTCTATSGGAVCGAANGTGALNDTGLDLPAGAVATYTVTFTVPATFTGDLVNTVTVTLPPSNTDPTPGNNTATDTDTAAQADVQVVKAISPGTAVQSGQVVAYTLTVTNNGPTDVTNAPLTDTPSAGLDCTTPSTTATCTASGGASCPGATVAVADLLGTGVTIPSLPVNGAVVVTMQCTVTATGVP